jgi:hypothetical protein
METVGEGSIQHLGSNALEITKAAMSPTSRVFRVCQNTKQKKKQKYKKKCKEKGNKIRQIS